MGLHRPPAARQAVLWAVGQRLPGFGSLARGDPPAPRAHPVPGAAPTQPAPESQGPFMEVCFPSALLGSRGLGLQSVGMLQLEQDPVMFLGTSMAAGVILLREEEEGEEGFGREGGAGGGCSKEKAPGCLVTGFVVGVRIPPASLSACELVSKSWRGSGVWRPVPELQPVGFGGGGLPWAVLPWGDVARGCQGFAGQVFASGLGHLEGIEFL